MTPFEDAAKTALLALVLVLLPWLLWMDAQLQGQRMRERLAILEEQLRDCPTPPVSNVGW